MISIKWTTFFQLPVIVGTSRSAFASEASNSAYDIHTLTWLVRSRSRLYKVRTLSLSPTLKKKEGLRKDGEEERWRVRWGLKVGLERKKVNYSEKEIEREGMRDKEREREKKREIKRGRDSWREKERDREKERKGMREREEERGKENKMEKDGKGATLREIEVKYYIGCARRMSP